MSAAKTEHSGHDRKKAASKQLLLLLHAMREMNTKNIQYWRSMTGVKTWKEKKVLPRHEIRRSSKRNVNLHKMSTLSGKASD